MIRVWCASILAFSGIATGAQVCHVDDFGAYGDGIHYDDAAFQDAFSACKSGGTIEVPSGKYLLSPFNLSSNIELYLHDDAVLLATTEIDKWQVVEPLPSYPIDYRYGPFIGGDNITNATIRGGSIDGQGQAWWDADDRNELQYGRPRLIEPRYCQDFALIDVHVMNPGFWGVHPYACDGVLVENVVFTAPNDSPNTDGIDPDSCSNVIIRNLTASCGDDAVAIKSGRDEEGRAFGMPSKNILVEGGNIGHSRGINIGSEMSGGVYNITIRDITFKGAMFAVRIKSARGRGGSVHDVTVEGLVLEKMEMAVAINMHYGSEDPAPPRDERTPDVYDITFRNITGSGVLNGGTFECLPESACHGLVLDNINIDSLGGFQCFRASGYTEGSVSPKSCL